MKKKYDIKTTDVETLKKWYHLMTLGRALDEKAPSYQLQSLGWSYHAPYAGHDGIQLAVGQVFTLGEAFCRNDCGRDYIERHFESNRSW